MGPAGMPDDCEELLRDLAAACEALRVLATRGEQLGLGLADAEGVAVVAAHLAAEALRRAGTGDAHSATASPDSAHGCSPGLHRRRSKA